MFFQDDVRATDDTSSHSNVRERTGLVQVQKKENIIEKSLDKLKETSTVCLCLFANIIQYIFSAAFMIPFLCNVFLCFSFPLHSLVSW